MSAPPELVEMQRALATALRSPEPLHHDEALSALARRHVAGNARLSPVDQVDLYREQFWARHLGSLAEDYVGLAALLGAEGFEAFLTAYLGACPPRHPSLRDLGDRIVAFGDDHDFAPEIRLIAREMLRYENALIDVFDGADVPGLDAQKLASMSEDDWDRARVVLHPLLFRLRLAHPVHAFRIAAKAAAEAGEPPPAPPAPRGVHLALFRGPDLVPSYEELDPAAFALLDLLARGTPLPRACEHVAGELDEAAAAALEERVGPWFQQWTAWRWIVDVDAAV